MAKSARPRWRRPAIWAGAGVVPFALLLWHSLPDAGSTDVAAAAVEIGRVTRAPFADYLPLRATVAPGTTTLVGVLAGGRVERLLVQDGAIVAAGQALATLANPELRLDVLTREAQIASQLGQVAGEGLGVERNRLERSVQVAQAEYDLIKARRELGVREHLHDRGFVSDAGVRSFREEAAYQERRLAQLRVGRATEARITAVQGRRLADTQARLSGNLAAVRQGLEALTIRAPAAGRLTNFTIQPGQTLRPGDPAGQVDAEGAWKLEADADEYFLGRVRVGQAARAGEGGGATLVVSKVLPTVKDGRFRVELTFDGAASARLNRGQTIDVRVSLGGATVALIAPAGAWLTSGGGTSAFVLDADGRHARRRAVRVGRRNPAQVELLSGLTAGERLVTSDTASVKGDVLNIR